jgi:predicted anti-sigma-YlaC factor YlaD
MGTAYTGGGLVHVLLVISAVVVAFRFLGAAGPFDAATVTCAVDRSK